eukprot:1373943-Rhodomonas_salina.1
MRKREGGGEREKGDGEEAAVTCGPDQAGRQGRAGQEQVNLRGEERGAAARARDSEVKCNEAHCQKSTRVCVEGHTSSSLGTPCVLMVTPPCVLELTVTRKATCTEEAHNPNVCSSSHLNVFWNTSESSQCDLELARNSTCLEAHTFSKLAPQRVLKLTNQRVLELTRNSTCAQPNVKWSSHLNAYSELVDVHSQLNV